MYCYHIKKEKKKKEIRAGYYYFADIQAKKMLEIEKEVN